MHLMNICSCSPVKVVKAPKRQQTIECFGYRNKLLYSKAEFTCPGKCVIYKTFFCFSSEFDET